LCVQRVGETSNQLPRLPEHGDNSVHNPDAQTRAGTLYAQLAQQQLMGAAGCQHELGSLVRGSYAAAAALEFAQVIFCFVLLLASLQQS
jgi:hypothetical protein